MGTASRDRNKVYLPLAGRRVLSWSLESAVRSAAFDRMVIVTRPEDEADLAALLRREAPHLPRGQEVELVEGGATRHESELAALRVLAPSIESGGTDVVAIHDGARPLTGPSLFRAVVDVARQRGGAVPCLPADAVLPLESARPVRTDDSPWRPAELVRVQTPQAFRARPLLAAYLAAQTEGFLGDDTADSVVRYSNCCPVVTVPGSRRNLKVTYAQDLFLAEWLLARMGYHLP